MISHNDFDQARGNDGVTKVDCNTGLAWLGFWIFAAVFVACDHWIYSQGYDSFFQSHKTPAEKELQQLKIQKLRKEVESP